MSEAKQIYDRRYLGSYREKANGPEFARWKALEHLIGKTLKLSQAGAVLDYGCGSGLHVELWKKLFPATDLYFCDISSVALRKLADKYPEYKLKCAEIKKDKAPIKSSFFDVVMSIEVMEHVENLRSYLDDIYRLLKPGGIFIWTTPCGNALSIEHMWNVLTSQIDQTDEGYRRWTWEDPTHLRRLKSAEARAELQQIGFDEIGFRFRSHLFSFVGAPVFETRLRKSPLVRRSAEMLMLLDYSLFRKLPNGASMIGFAKKACEQHARRSAL